MNIYRLIGDLSHTISVLILCHHLRKTQNARGISAKSIELYLVVYVNRYLDLFTTFYSWYNSFMKIFYICMTTWILYNIKFKEPICSTYDRARDAFLHWKFAVAPCAIIAFIVHSISGYFDLLEYLWTFSICLESIAIIPQLIFLKHYRDVDDLIQYSILLQGLYRVFFIMNWIHRAHHEPHYIHHPLVYFCGMLQCILYFDFYYNFFLVRNNCARRRTSRVDEENGDNSSSDNNTSSNDRKLLTIYLLDESRWVA